MNETNRIKTRTEQNSYEPERSKNQNKSKMEFVSTPKQAANEQELVVSVNQSSLFVFTFLLFLAELLGGGK